MALTPAAAAFMLETLTAEEALLEAQVDQLRADRRAAARINEHWTNEELAAAEVKFNKIVDEVSRVQTLLDNVRTAKLAMENVTAHI